MQSDQPPTNIQDTYQLLHLHLLNNSGNHNMCQIGSVLQRRCCGPPSQATVSKQESKLTTYTAMGPRALLASLSMPTGQAPASRICRTCPIDQHWSISIKLFSNYYSNQYCSSRAPQSDKTINASARLIDPPALLALPRGAKSLSRGP